MDYSKGSLNLPSPPGHPAYPNNLRNSVVAPWTKHTVLANPSESSSQTPSQTPQETTANGTAVPQWSPTRHQLLIMMTLSSISFMVALDACTIVTSLNMSHSYSYFPTACCRKLIIDQGNCNRHEHQHHRGHLDWHCLSPSQCCHHAIHCRSQQRVWSTSNPHDLTCFLHIRNASMLSRQQCHPKFSGTVTTRLWGCWDNRT